MILKESLWYRDIIRHRVRPGAVVLNIGSSTKQFVEIKQPYIKENVLDELQKKGCVVQNVDIKESEGVDFIGDISDPTFAQFLRARTSDVVICANAHEHVSNRGAFSKGLQSLIQGETILIVSVPCTFPYHEDPIDTMYRVDIEGLSKEFPNLELLEGDVIGVSYFSVIARNFGFVQKGIFLIKRTVKLLLAVLTLRWKDAADIGWVFRRVYETCAVYKRRPTP